METLQAHAFKIMRLSSLSVLLAGSLFLCVCVTSRGGDYADQYDPDSLENPYGAGSPYKPDGLMNPYSKYGSEYSNQSWTNPYATDPPKLYDSDGNYRGKLSANPYDPDSTSNPYGRYGSEFSPDSINNTFGAGNPYSGKKIYVEPQGDGGLYTHRYSPLYNPETDSNLRWLDEEHKRNMEAIDKIFDDYDAQQKAEEERRKARHDEIIREWDEDNARFQKNAPIIDRGPELEMEVIDIIAKTGNPKILHLSNGNVIEALPPITTPEGTFQRVKVNGKILGKKIEDGDNTAQTISKKKKTYEVKREEDGKVIKIESDHPPTEQELDEAFKLKSQNSDENSPPKKPQISTPTRRNDSVPQVWMPPHKDDPAKAYKEIDDHFNKLWKQGSKDVDDLIQKYKDRD